jgi:hypothetical protein
LQNHKNLHGKGTGNHNVTHEIPYLSLKILTFKNMHVPQDFAYVHFLNLAEIMDPDPEINSGSGQV